MKLNKIFFSIFFLSILAIGIFQAHSIILANDYSFQTQIENHLTSTTELKTERINDYLQERQNDAKILSQYSQIKSLLNENATSNDEITKENIEEKLETISKQMKIFIEKYPNQTFENWQENEEFKNLSEQKIGKTYTTEIINLENFNENSYDVYKSTDTKTFDGITIGIATKINYKDFKGISNPLNSSENYAQNFQEISNYTNLILIDKDGFVIYQNNENSKFQTNLNYESEKGSELAQAYLSNQKNNTKIYGPFQENNQTYLLFTSKIYEGTEQIGTLILQDSTKKINEISSEVSEIGKTEDTYLVDQEQSLITPAKNDDASLFIQTINSQNAINCLQNYPETISQSQNYEGEEVLGKFSKVEETNWCVLSEINYEEVFETPKEKSTTKNLLFIIFSGLFSISIIIIVSIKLSKYEIEKKDSKKILAILITFLFCILSVSAISITASIPEKYQEVSGGERIYFTIAIKYPENPSRVDLRLEYNITGPTGEQVASSKALKAVETQASFIDYIVLPEELNLGLHTITIYIKDYGDLSEVVQTSFEVAKNRIDKLYIMVYSLIATVGVLGILVVFLLFKKS